jgi:hypothetical protein
MAITEAFQTRVSDQPQISPGGVQRRARGWRLIQRKQNVPPLQGGTSGHSMPAAGAVNRHEAGRLRCKLQVFRGFPAWWKKPDCNP